MREDDIDRIERIQTLRNDQRVREQAQQGTTYKAFADADVELPGRFQSIAAAHVVGSTPTPKYPELPADSPFHHDPVPNEPPLSAYDNPALNDPADVVTASADSSVAPPAEATGGVVAPSSSLLPDVEPAPPSSPNNRNE